MTSLQRIRPVWLIAICLFTMAGCGDREEPRTAVPQALTATIPAASSSRAATAQEIALVADGTQLYSPDSGKLVIKNARTPALVHGGRLYFFCCPTSMQQCQSNPSLLGNARPPNGYDLEKLRGAGK
jgi:hypothetical protein